MVIPELVSKAKDQYSLEQAWSAVVKADQSGRLHRVLASVQLAGGGLRSAAGPRAANITALLLFAWLLGWRPPQPGPTVTRVLMHLEAVKEELGLGPWVRHLETLAKHVRFKPEANAIEPRAVARRLFARLQPVVVRTPPDPDTYLLEVARHYGRLKDLQEALQRTSKLVRRARSARLKARDLLEGHRGWTRVALGRLRDHRPIWIEGSPDEVAKARRVLARMLSRQGRALPDRWRYTKESGREHPALAEAKKRLWAWIGDRAPEEEVLPPRDGWAHSEVVREDEHALLDALGLSFDALVRASVVRAIDAYLAARKELPEDTPVLLDARAMTPDAWALVGDGAEFGTIRAALERIRARLVRPEVRRKEHPLRRALIEVLRSTPGLSQKATRVLHRRAAEGKASSRELNILVAAVLPAALAPMLPYADTLGEDLIGLAWEVAREAVLTQRSFRHHPGALAERIARRQAGYEAEAVRQATTVRAEGIKTLHKVRRLIEAGIREPAEIAARLRVPVRWVELHLPLLTGAAHLEDPLGEDRALGDTVAGGDDPERVIELQTLRDLVERALEKLPAVHREMVERVLMEGAPLEEVAETTGYPEPFLNKVLEESKRELAADPYLKDWVAA